MRKMRSVFIELKVAHDTVIGEIFGEARFSDAQMLGQAGLDGIGAAAATGSIAQEARRSYAQSLARLNVVVGGKIGITQKQHAGTGGGAIRFVELQGRAGQQPAELHFQEREAGRKTWIAIATAHSSTGIRGDVGGQTARSNGFGDSTETRFGSFVHRGRGFVLNRRFHGHSRLLDFGAGFATIAAAPTSSAASTPAR